MFRSRLLDWSDTCFGFSLKSVLVYILIVYLRWHFWSLGRQRREFHSQFCLGLAQVKNIQAVAYQEDGLSHENLGRSSFSIYFLGSIFTPSNPKDFSPEKAVCSQISNWTVGNLIHCWFLKTPQDSCVYLYSMDLFRPDVFPIPRLSP